jgi:GNAT superfamily N-acetyltransferase
MSDSLPNNPLKIRLATIDDVPTIFKLIQDLATYEKLAHEVTGSEELLKEHLFGKKVYIEVILAEIGDQAAGLALFFPNYSTFLTKPGIYLEDLFVVPEYRRRGVGKALISYLAKLVVERDYGRLEWSVLEWNVNAIAFYEKIGATVLPDWRTCRVTGSNLQELAK